MITSSQIAWGDQLGAQLTKLAQLIYIAKVNDQEIVLWGELMDYRRRYQFLDVFEQPNFLKIINRCGVQKKRLLQIYFNNYHKKPGDWRSRMNRIYGNRYYRYIDRIVYEWVRLSYMDFKQLKGYINGIHTDSRLLSLDISKNYDIMDGYGTYRDWGGTGT